MRPHEARVNAGSASERRLDRGVRPAGAGGLAGPACADTADRPPVVIMNLSYTGLGIARDLAGRGLRVVGLSADRKARGGCTRLCEVRFSPNSGEEPEQLAEFLVQAAAELPGAVIFPTGDFDVLFLDRFRARLEPHYRLSIPPHPCLLEVMDKHAQLRAALRAGVPVPRTVVVTSAAELEGAAAQIGFPAVVKPLSSFHWRAEKALEVVGHSKALRAESLEELQRMYERAAALCPQLLVQEWIPGGAEEIVIWGGYLNASSEPLAYFTARKLQQWPEDFGTGCLVESADIPQLLEPTVRLLRVLGHRGMAEVEYKRDARTGEHKLIEVNPRHWDWHELGRASGVNLSWTAYCDLTGAPPAPARVRWKWVAEDVLLFNFLKGAAHGRIRLGSLWRGLRGPRIYGLFSWNDPLPFLAFWFTRLPGMAARKMLSAFRGGGKRNGRA